MRKQPACFSRSKTSGGIRRAASASCAFAWTKGTRSFTAASTAVPAIVMIPTARQLPVDTRASSFPGRAPLVALLGEMRESRKPMHRRDFLRLSTLGGSSLALGLTAFWRDVYAAPPTLTAEGPYGALSATPDANGVRLPKGFTSRILARSGEPVPGTRYPWHMAPDGGACFPMADGGWAYTSNSEVGPGGGVSALRFDKKGRVVDAYR